MAGKFECRDVISSLEVAKKIADAFEVSLDYLLEEGVKDNFDEKDLKTCNYSMVKEKHTIRFI